MFRPKSAPSLKTRMAMQAQQKQVLLSLANSNSNKEMKTQTWNADTTLPSPPQKSRSTNNLRKGKKPASQLSPLYKAVRRTKTNFTTTNVVRKKRGKGKKKLIKKQRNNNNNNRQQQQQLLQQKQHFIINTKPPTINNVFAKSNTTKKPFRSDSLQIQIEFQEKLRILKEQAKHDRFGIEQQNIPQNINKTGFYSKIFALHEEYFGKICENDLSYGHILKLIKGEYDKQFQLAGKTDHGKKIIQNCQQELKNVNQMLKKEQNENKTLKEEISRLNEEMELLQQRQQQQQQQQEQEYSKTLPLSTNNHLQHPRQQFLSQLQEHEYNGSPIPSPVRNKLKTPTNQIKRNSNNGGSNNIMFSTTNNSVNSEGKYDGSSIINSSLTTTTAKNLDAVSPTEVKELREEVKLLRMFISEQNPKAWKEIFGSGSITSNVGSLINSSSMRSSHDNIVATPENDLSNTILNNSHISTGSDGNGSGRLLNTPPNRDLNDTVFIDEHKSNNNNKLSQERLKLHHRFTSNTLSNNNNSWENIGELDGARLGSSSSGGGGGGKFKSRPLLNIPEGQSIGTHGSLLPLTNIPEEEYLSETSRSVMTDRSIRSVLSDASSMALSPRLNFGKELSRPSDVPSLELNHLADLKDETSESDVESTSSYGGK